MYKKGSLQTLHLILNLYLPLQLNVDILMHSFE